jgi:hypothetical protein
MNPRWPPRAFQKISGATTQRSPRRRPWLTPQFSQVHSAVPKRASDWRFATTSIYACRKFWCDCVTNRVALNLICEFKLKIDA